MSNETVRKLRSLVESAAKSAGIAEGKQVDELSVGGIFEVDAFMVTNIKLPDEEPVNAVVFRLRVPPFTLSAYVGDEINVLPLGDALSAEIQRRLPPPAKPSAAVPVAARPRVPNPMSRQVEVAMRARKLALENAGKSGEVLDSDDDSSLEG